MMVYMTHPQHGTTIVYVAAEVESNKLNGWIVQEEKELAVKIEVAPEIASQELSLNERYFEKFGKYPHHRLSEKNIEIALKG